MTDAPGRPLLAGRRVRTAVLLLAAVATVLAGAGLAIVTGGSDDGEGAGGDAGAAPPSASAAADATGGSAVATSSDRAAASDPTTTVTASPTATAPSAAPGSPGGPPAELVAVTEDRRLVVRDVTSGAALRELAAYPGAEPAGPESPGSNVLVDVEVGPGGDGVYAGICCEPVIGVVDLVPLEGGVSRRLSFGRGLSVSPGGERLAIGRLGGLALLAGPDDEEGTELLAQEERRRVFATSWSPDGRRIAFELESFEETGNAVGVIAADVGAEPRILDPPAGQRFTDPVWRDDGRVLFAATPIEGAGPSTGLVVDPATLETVARFPLDGRVVDLDYDTSGAWLLVVLEDETMRYEGRGTQTVIGGGALAASW